MSVDNEEPNVGYARPPVATRWKKGQSGNPSGRPRKDASPREISQEILNTPLKSKNGRPLKKTRQDLIMYQKAKDALTNPKAARSIFEIAYPSRKKNRARIPPEVSEALREILAIRKVGYQILRTDSDKEAGRKWNLFLREGHLIGQIEHALKRIRLSTEDGDA